MLSLVPLKGDGVHLCELGQTGFIALGVWI